MGYPTLEQIKTILETDMDYDNKTYPNIYDYVKGCWNNAKSVETKTNMLLVSLTDPLSDTNKVHRILTSDAASDLTNSPVTSGTFIAKWECIFFETNVVMVQITELYPKQGRVWSNLYRSGWQGWKSNMVEENVALTTVSSTSETDYGITLKYYKKSNVVTVTTSGALTSSFSAGATMQLGTLPSGARPLTTLYSFTQKNATLQIGSDGAVYIINSTGSTIASGSYLSGNCTFGV